MMSMLDFVVIFWGMDNFYVIQCVYKQQVFLTKFYFTSFYLKACLASFPCRVVYKFWQFCSWQVFLDKSTPCSKLARQFLNKEISQGKLVIFCCTHEQLKLIFENLSRKTSPMQLASFVFEKLYIEIQREI